MLVGSDFATYVKKTAPAVQRCKDQQQRCSYGRDRVGVAGTNEASASAATRAGTSNLSNVAPSSSGKRTGSNARRCTKASSKVAKGIGVAERYVALVHGDAYASAILDAGGAVPAIAAAGQAPSVIFDDVVFRYDAAAPRAVLDRVSLALEPGVATALVGPSGSGKSSLGKLLLRLHDPEAGAVRVDGADLRRLDALAHRRRVGVVPQDPQLFDRTVAENVARGRRAGFSSPRRNV